MCYSGLGGSNSARGQRFQRPMGPSAASSGPSPSPCRLSPASATTATRPIWSTTECKGVTPEQRKAAQTSGLVANASDAVEDYFCQQKIDRRQPRGCAEPRRTKPPGRRSTPTIRAARDAIAIADGRADKWSERGGRRPQGGRRGRGGCDRCCHGHPDLGRRWRGGRSRCGCFLGRVESGVLRANNRYVYFIRAPKIRRVVPRYRQYGRFGNQCRRHPGGQLRAGRRILRWQRGSRHRRECHGISLRWRGGIRSHWNG